MARRTDEPAPETAGLKAIVASTKAGSLKSSFTVDIDWMRRMYNLS
jgi:hypothetical protein